MKKADLEKMLGKKITAGGFGSGNDRYGKDANAPMDRREQRERDRELGLLAFAVKLPGDLVKEVQAVAQKRGEGLSEVTAELLRKGLKAK